MDKTDKKQTYQRLAREKRQQLLSIRANCKQTNIITRVKQFFFSNFLPVIVGHVIGWTVREMIKGSWERWAVTLVHIISNIKHLVI